MQALEILAVYPSFLPIIPTTFEPIFLAKFKALIILTLIFFFRFPPPTEKTNNISFFFNLLILSHSIKTDSHPSSLTLAVNSDTLSVGA